jgi:hypothetical protein
MTEPQTALMAFVRARRGDKVLSALLATAADKFRSQAEAESAALRQEARQLRKASLQDLRSAKSRFEAADRRMEAIVISNGGRSQAARPRPQEISPAAGLRFRRRPTPCRRPCRAPASWKPRPRVR